MAIKYKEIVSILREQIISRGSLVSYKLPTEKELCQTYAVSRQTIRHALDLLTKEGLICSKQGSGIYTLPLSAHTANKVVFLLSEKDEYTYPAFISFMQKQLAMQNITPIIHITDQNYNTERALLTSLLKQPPIVLVVEGVRDAFDNPNLDLYEQLMAQHTSVVFLGSGYDFLPQAHRIASDDYMGGYLLGEHLIACGQYQASCILPDYAANARLRYQGLLAAYRDHSLPMPSDEIHWYNWNDLKCLRTKQDTRFLYSFVRSHKEGNAVFCYNDEIAYHLIKEFSLSRIHCPEDAAVVSFDNSYLSRISTPPITTLSLKEHSLETELAEHIHFLFKQYTKGSEVYFSHQTTVRFANRLIGQKTLPWKLISRSSVPIP